MWHSMQPFFAWAGIAGICSGRNALGATNSVFGRFSCKTRTASIVWRSPSTVLWLARVSGSTLP